MLSRSELRALTALHGTQTITELANRLDRSPSYTSELVVRLEKTGLIKTRRRGKVKQIRPSDAKAFELLMDLSQRYAHIEWVDLLSGSTLRILYYLETPRTATDLAHYADVHRSTIYRSLDPLQHRGIIYKTDDGAYALNEAFEQLSDFARELAHHLHRQIVARHIDTYTILWESLDEFLVQTPMELSEDAFVPTGPDQFRAYELPLLTRERWYYLYSEKTNEISPAMLCCHMLVIDTGTRTQSYCLLLLCHVDIDRDELREQASKYDVSDLVDDLLSYLETNGCERTSWLPPWEEFQELAAQYGVAI